MHKSSMELMQELLKRVPNEGHVLDCGSAIANTGLQFSYREMCESKGLIYTGFDAQAGKNVDVVGDIYELQTLQWYDVVISGQMLEHLEFPLLAVQNMKRVVKVGGQIILIAPWQYGIHRYPIDCWRVLPDGMHWLLEGFSEVHADRLADDCWGIGRKPVGYKEPWNISRS